MEKHAAEHVSAQPTGTVGRPYGSISVVNSFTTTRTRIWAFESALPIIPARFLPVTIGMDAQLRTRLIGAAVLIGLAVIFLPMLLDRGDQNESSSTEEIALDIPQPDTDGMSTRTLPLNSDAPMVEVDARTADPIPEVNTARAAPTVARLASESEPTPAANPAESTPSPSSSENAGSIERTAEPQPSPTPVTPAVAAPVAQTTSTPVATSPSGRFGVNFGSYSSKENAQRLVAQLQQLKVQASAEMITVNGKALYRVAAKGYPTRTAAEAARLSAIGKINGLNASILQGELPSQSAPATTVAPALQSFAVQIGVYGDKIKADELVNQLKAKGFAAFGERVITPSGSTIRVRVGPILKRPQAEQIKADIKSKLALDSIVVPYP